MKCNQWIEGTIEPHGLPYCRCGGDIPSPWRDVREALPDNDVPVLVYCQYASDMEYEIDIAYITDLEWTSSTTGEIIDVKYWAELPAPPAGEEE
jgi:hypothetical protein